MSIAARGRLTRNPCADRLANIECDALATRAPCVNVSASAGTQIAEAAFLDVKIASFRRGDGVCEVRRQT